MTQLEKLKQEKREAKAQMTIAKPLRGYLGNKYDYWKSVYDKATDKINKLKKPQEKKMFSRELALVHIFGLYITLCEGNYRGNSREEWEKEQEKRKITFFKPNQTHHSTIIPKILMTWDDIKDFAVFQGYPMKERRELFDIVINRGGFRTYIVGKKTFYGIAV
jgi:hypothetical protein